MAENNEGKNVGRFDASSKFWRTFLVIVATFLIFAGPTYIIYVLLNILEVSYAVSMISGFVLFVIGLVLMWYLVRKKIIA